MRVGWGWGEGSKVGDEVGRWGWGGCGASGGGVEDGGGDDGSNSDGDDGS